jgi:alkanesulfonate monooxygenase SsuD/methylene tetrahydromethanopterin reductase-like flavin-dependent oxidoreductase (luciferase family)
METLKHQDQSGTDSSLDVVVHAGEVPLSGPQRQAMEWLMQGGSIVEAAQYAGVTRQTVSRWIHEDPDFATLFEHWQEQVKSINKARLVSLTEAAMDTVSDAIRNHRDVKAALTILKGAGVLGKGT